MPVSSGTSSVDDALRDTLVVESMDLLHGDLVLEESGTGTLWVRGLQPIPDVRLSPGEYEGRGSYHVSGLSKGIPCIVVIPPEGWSS